MTEERFSSNRLACGRMNDLTMLLENAAHGDAHSLNQLYDQVYAELRAIAGRKMAAERAGHTLQPTALVHEAYLRLGGAEPFQFENRAHFFAAAAQAMRRILIENARRKKSPKHGGDLQRVALEDAASAQWLRSEELLALDEALEKLGAEDPEAARLVDLRYFVGLGHQEAAEIMGIGRRQADSLWAYARAWLFGQMRKDFGAKGAPESP